MTWRTGTGARGAATGTSKRRGPDWTIGANPARFPVDADAPALAHAVLVEAWITSGRAHTIDTFAAERADGVLAIITPRALPCLPRAVAPLRQATTLLDPEIGFSGQALAVVVAEALDLAQYAAGRIEVKYGPSNRPLSMEPVSARATSRAAPYPPGDAAYPRGIFSAAHRFFTSNAAIEPTTTIAGWHGKRLTVYDSCHFVHTTAVDLAAVFRLPVNDVRVISPVRRSGTPCSVALLPHIPLAALAARLVSRPVKLSLSKRQIASSIARQLIRAYADTNPAHRVRTAQGSSAVGSSGTLK